MNLYKNAILSIQMGIDDFKSVNEGRAISAVRNIFSGLVLLYKSKLWELSPPDDPYCLITDEPIFKIEDNRVIVSSKNPNEKPSKTINIQQIKELFISFNIGIDWKLFDTLKKERNQIEHFFSNSNSSLLKKTIRDAFILISTFF